MKHYIVSLEEARQFLDSHFSLKTTQVELLNGGDWSAAYAYVLEGEEYVIRFAASREDFAKDQAISQYASGKLHVPKVTEIGKALRGFYAISERHHGIFLDELDGEQMRKTLPSLLRTLDEIREVDLTSTTAYGWWEAKGAGNCVTWREFLTNGFDDKPGERTHGWRKKLESSSVGSDTFDKIRSSLEVLAADMPSERHLIHNDLLYRNVLVEDNEISVVIDWGNSMYGDFLYDIALLIYYWSWFPRWEDIDIKKTVVDHYASIGLEVPDIEKRLLCYQIHIGLDGIKYSAFTGNQEHLEQKTEQTLKLLDYL
jgi:hygromycin-B 4-O-kinase